MDPRTKALIEAPITPTLLRLAIPNVITTTVQASTGLIEAYFIGKLGTDALAGVALVFPGVMLMQMMSAGAMGGGVSSAIARALGAGRREDADATILHALLIAAGFAAFFTVSMIAAGPWLYAALGGRGGSLAVALTYSNIVFAGVILIWLFNTLANVIRGTGNTFIPALVTIAGAALLIPLSAALIFGFGPLPALGAAGGASALLIYYGLGTLAFAAYLWSGRSVVRPKIFETRLRWPLFRDILRIGLLASLTSIMTNVTIALTTGVVGVFGPAAIAGYGVGTRLEYLLVPLAFGFGGPLVALVGTNIGAGKRDRALRAAWIGGWLCFALTGAIGVAAALFPAAWLTLFDNDPAMIEAGSTYLRIVGPFYGFFGLGMALYFASQGAGALKWPLIAGFSRLIIAAGGGWLLVRTTGSLTLVFAALALGLVVLGLMIAVAVKGGAWFRDAHDKPASSR
ncbi:MAG: MATE family efflux transporter [Xanthobacteraceae bacterium]|nr:MATE family efflux transporter [Xanthobacteraceae bacterium]